MLLNPIRVLMNYGSRPFFGLRYDTNSGQRPAPMAHSQIQLLTQCFKNGWEMVMILGTLWYKVVPPQLQVSS